MPRSNFQYLIASHTDIASMADALASFTPVSNNVEAVIYRFPREIPQPLLTRISNAGWAEARLMDCAHFILQNNPLTQQALYNGFFDYIGAEYESLISVSRNCDNIKHLLYLLRQHSGSLEAKELIDFGCGTGLALTQLQAAKAQFVGVDQSAHMRDIAQHRGMNTIDLVALRGRPSRFDGAIASYVLHMVSDETAIAGVASSLKKGATLVGNFHKGLNVQWMDGVFAKYGCKATRLDASAIHGTYIGYTKLR